MLDVCVVGTGYVGLVTGTCLAELGHRVVCVDSDADKIARLRNGDIPIYEIGLEQLVSQNTRNHRLRFTTELSEAVRHERLALFFAIGTPTASGSADADLTALFGAIVEAVRCRRASRIDGFVALVIKSTVPVGTCARIEALVAQYLPHDRFAVVSNPEFLREGCAVRDFLFPDRIVVGSSSKQGLALMRSVYAPLTDAGHRLVEHEAVETSEMIKYASNIFLATKIALVNEFALLCEKVGADVEDLAAGISLDGRIGSAGLRAGPGFGGSCFPKDLRALVRTAEIFGSAMPIAEAVIRSNERQKRSMIARIVDGLGGDVRDRRIAILGLSFKAGTDDVREAPAITLVEGLLEKGASVAVYDPAAMDNFARIVPGVECQDTAEAAMLDADAAVVATEWPEFIDLAWWRIRDAMARPLIFDLRNHLDGALLGSLGYGYVGLGRKSAMLDEQRNDGLLDEDVTALGIAAE